MIKREMETNVEALKMSVYRSTMDKMQVFCNEPFGDGNPTIGSVYTDNPDEPAYTYRFELAHYNQYRLPEMRVIVNVLGEEYRNNLTITKDGLVVNGKVINLPEHKTFYDIHIGGVKEEVLKSVTDEVTKWMSIKELSEGINSLEFLQTDSINSFFKDEIEKFNVIHQMEEELEDYDEFQYQKFVKNVTQNGVVEFPLYPKCSWNNLHTDDKQTTLSVSMQAPKHRLVYQTKWGKKTYDYVDNLKVTPLKGSKWSFVYIENRYNRSTETYYDHTIEGTLTKLQFENMLKGVWNLHKKVEEAKDTFNEEMEYFVEISGVTIKQNPIITGEYVVVDGELILKSDIKEAA
jgi:hypothetical protein